MPNAYTEHMRTRHFRLPLAILAIVLSRSIGLYALPVDLGVAGPSNFTILDIGTGGTVSVNAGGPVNGITGNVGIYTDGALKLTGGSPTFVTGNVVLGTGASTSLSGSSVINGSTVTNQALLDQARNAAFAAAAAAKLLTGSAIADITSTMVLNAGVYYVDQINLGNGKTLTLNGGAGDSVVLNISKDFKLADSDIVLTGGLREQNVLFNYYGEHDVAFSGGGNASEAHGILLSLGRKVNLAPGYWYGEIISDENICIVSGANVQGTTVTVPDGGSTFALMLVAFGGVFVLRSKFSSVASVRA